MNYNNEKDGQIAFYNAILPRVNRDLSIDEILMDNNDGILNGNILEFKLQINDVATTLFQAIKYLSNRRIKGKEIPANILLISLNDNKIYHFNSEDYLDKIEVVYQNGAASKDNAGFVLLTKPTVFDFSKDIDKEKVILKLKENNYTKINLDDNCIIGWAERFYKENPDARKQDFIGDSEGIVKVQGEIRKPRYFKDFIYPYTKATNAQFMYLMDKLNDDLTQRKLGAFYTPKAYANKAIELLEKAISRVPKGNDYIILDRCAGTGNLEEYMTDDMLSHTIISTIEYYEFKVLQERFGDKVRHIIPAIETEDTFNRGLVTGADALSEEYINNSVIKEYVDNPKCNVIIFENPPYAEASGIENQKAGVSKAAGAWKNGYVPQEFKKHIQEHNKANPNNKIVGQASNDMANCFIWSGFEYFLNKPEDSMVVFSPAKYWKSQNVLNKECGGAFIFDRGHFHATAGIGILCALWHNIDKVEESIDVHAYQIDKKTGNIIDDGIVTGQKAYDKLSDKFNDKELVKRSTIKDGDNCIKNGEIYQGEQKLSTPGKYDNDFIGYAMLCTNNIDNPALDSLFVTNCLYGGHGSYLTRSNALYKLPANSVGQFKSMISSYKYNGFINKTADGYDRYMQDVNNGKLTPFLLKNLFWASTNTLSRTRSIYGHLDGNDNHLYINHFTLDNSAQSNYAMETLKEHNFFETMTDAEKEIYTVFNNVIELAKECDNYNPEFNYGIYQVINELNTFYKDEKGKRIYNYPELNSHINTLKVLTKKYYINELVDTFWEYEFLK